MTLEIPTKFKGSTDLVQSKKITASILIVKPMQIVVWYVQ